MSLIADSCMWAVGRNLVLGGCIYALGVDPMLDVYMG